MRAMAAVTILLMTLAAGPAGAGDTASRIEALEWLTEQYPPYNYVDPEDGLLKGISVDVLMGMFERCGVGLTRQDVKVVPWARGYSRTQKTPGVALFAMTYTEERAQSFRFVGPLIPTRVSVIAAADRGVQVSSPRDLDELKIGTIRDDIGYQLVRALGVPESAIEQKNSAAQMVQMLARGRFDAIAYAEDIAWHQLRLAGLDPAEYEPVYALRESYIGYAFHKATDPAVLGALQTALNQMRAEGLVDSAYVRHMGHLPAQP